jgi:hypothetical protein
MVCSWPVTSNALRGHRFASSGTCSMVVYGGHPLDVVADIVTTALFGFNPTRPWREGSLVLEFLDPDVRALARVCTLAVGNQLTC